TGPQAVANVLERFPDPRFVIAHMGMPEYDACADLAEGYDHVHLDTTTFAPGHVSSPAEVGPAYPERLPRLGERIVLGGARQPPLGRRCLRHRSSATALSTTAPRTPACVGCEVPLLAMPLALTALIRPPMIAPWALPTPPVTAAPPMKAAAIASSSNMLPAPGWALFERAE